MISIVIPTLNSERTLGECLDAILAQAYPREGYEIVIADAGSSDATLEIARARGVDVICENPLKTGEAGKAAGIQKSRGEFIALIDSDNILPDAGWLSKMMEPFRDDEIFATEPIRYSARPGDPSLTRYFAWLGMNDPVCLFVGNYDRVSAVTGKWTGLDVPTEKRDGYLKVHPEKKMPTIGANGFVFRRSILERVNWEPYFFDIDVAAEAVAKGCGAIAKVDVSIIHLYCARFGDFARKQRRRIRDFLFFAKAKERSYPWESQRKGGIVLFAFSAVLVLPLIMQAVLFACRVPKGEKRLSLWHLPVCYATLWIYGIAVLGKVCGVKPKMVDRAGWQRSG
ncbi:MAG: glycosyltransferase family 2 protein [Kiritimatiellae bacterium]|nr:glycosyltransferase family 2 protein [Kiritimatiellia bacterium]